MNIENIQAAVAYLQSIPSTQWDLDCYYNAPCHRGCALGHLAVGRQFGLKMGICFPELEMDDGQHIGMDAANRIFGIANADAVYLFGLKTMFEKSLGLPNDKEVFMRRVARYLRSNNYDESLMYGPEQTEPTGPSDDADSEHAHIYEMVE